MQNISDKLIDSQGPTATISSGADSKLYYIDENGKKLDYVLKGTSHTDEVTFQNNKLTIVDGTVTSGTLNFRKNISNAGLIFKTGSSVSITTNYEDGMYINRQLEFAANKIYYISVSDGIILWNELIQL